MKDLLRKPDIWRSPPDWQCLGTYYDDADRTIDGRINIDIKNPDGIATGTWHYEVYGYEVEETEDYYI